MFYLRTGLPGASKTLNTIKEITEDIAILGRPRFYYNIRLFFLDYDVCNSFEGFFYGYYLQTCDDKTRLKIQKIILRAHRNDEMVSIDDVPFLRGAYDSWACAGGGLDLFLVWVFKVYPKPCTAALSDYLDLVERPVFEDIQNFHLHFTQFVDPTSWPQLPNGSVIIIDECQQAFPPRPVGSKVPAHVQSFETHRHAGFDVHLITQDAKLLDSHVRRLVNRHIHFHNPLSGKKVSRLQSDKLFDPNDYHQKQKAISSLITRDTKFYGLYWSADLHTHKGYLPKKIIVLAVVALAIPVALIAWVNFRFLGGEPEPVVRSVPVVSNSPSLPAITRPVVRPAYGFNVGDHPLSTYCDSLALGSVERFGSSDHGFSMTIMFQCEKTEKKEKDVSTVRYELLSVQYLRRLGYSVEIRDDIVSVRYEENIFLVGLL